MEDRRQFVRTCDCGCGQPTPIAQETDHRRGIRKGQPQHFRLGHYHRNLTPAVIRFWAKVDKSGGPLACWPWLGSLAGYGYGRIWHRGRHVPAHRFAYELLVGPIPEGMEIDHVKERGCTRRNCVNPAHLEPVTRRVNTLRGDSFAGQNSRKTHCIHGHEFTPENTGITKKQRFCRICKRRADREHEVRRRAK